MTTTPTERRLAITPDPMNNPKDMLVSEPLSSEWIAYVISTRTEEGAINVISMAAAKLRSERDELVGALRRMTDRASEIGQLAVDAMDGEDFHLLADAISMSREVLAKHKPE
jgi:hypothetical protein